MLTGTCRMEQTHYDNFRAFVLAHHPEMDVPHSNTILKRLRADIIRDLCVTPRMEEISIRERSRGAKPTGTGKVICLVTPQQYGDFVARNFLRGLKGTWLNRSSPFEVMPLIRDRRFFFGSETVSVDETDIRGHETELYAELGDKILYWKYF